MSEVIVHVITGLNIGGAESMLSKLVSKGNNADTEDVVISLMSGGELRERISGAGVRVEDLGMSRGLPGIAGLFKYFALLRSLEPKVIQGWMYHGNLMAFLGGLFTFRKIGVFWNVRQCLENIDREKRLTRLIIRISSVLSPLVDGIVYNSSRSAADHERVGFSSKKRAVIGNGFDLELFKPDQEKRERIRRRLCVDEFCIVGGNVARLHPMKDHTNLVSACEKAMSIDERLHVVLAGRNVDAQSIGVSEKYLNRFHFLGQIADVQDFMPGMDFYISSSNSEGFPNVVGEAMSCGLPCAVTDVGESGVVVGNTGVIVEKENSEALCRAISSMLTMSAEARTSLGQNARASIKSTFSIHSICKQYSDLYMSAGN